MADRWLVMHMHVAAFALSLIPNGDGTYRLPRADPGIGGDEFCPIPIDPLFLIGQPIGMYHCPYCGSMIVAGVPHPDYTDDRQDTPTIGDVLNEMREDRL